MVTHFFFTIKMALEFDVNAFLSINIGKSLDGIARSLVSAETQCLGQWTVLIASTVLTGIAMLAFSTREFRVKTPEGN